MPLVSAFTKRFLSLSILILASALLFKRIMNASLTEKIYSNGMYPFIRKMLNIPQQIPFPFFFLFLLVSIGFLIYQIKKLFDKNQRMNASLQILSLLMLFGGLFFWLWGMHYGRIPFHEHLKADVSAYADSTQFMKDFMGVVENADVLRKQSFQNDRPISIETLHNGVKNNENQLKQQLEGVLNRFYPNERLSMSVKTRAWPKGWLLRNGIAGMYFPFTGEATYDGDLHPFRLPFTMTHELAHSAGITCEGDCNFLAYLACMQSTNTFVQYSAQLERISYMLYYGSGGLGIRRSELMAHLPENIRKDLWRIRKHHSKYRGKMSDFGDWVNDQYLKTQGIQAGVEDYAKWILMLKGKI